MMRTIFAIGNFVLFALRLSTRIILLNVVEINHGYVHSVKEFVSVQDA